MFDTQSLLGMIAEKAAQVSHKEEGDYVVNDILYCGKCHTPKQARLPVAGMEIVPCICKCQNEMFERQEAERKRIEHEDREMDLVRSLSRYSIMDARLKDATFDRFIPRKDNEKALRKARWYAEHFDVMQEKNQGLLFWGGPSTGKTFTAACIANYLLERRVSVLVTSFAKLLSEISFGEDADRLSLKLRRVSLLVIDDLGAERSTDYAMEKVYGIIDDRYRAERPIILTTNNAMQDMKAETNIQYSRIYERIFEMCYPVEFNGRSWRKVSARNRFYEMEKLMEETE